MYIYNILLFHCNIKEKTNFFMENGDASKWAKLCVLSSSSSISVTCINPHETAATVII